MNNFKTTTEFDSPRPDMKEYQKMRLHALPFAQIKAGIKTIEARVNDEKRRKLRVGDEIEFTSRETGEEIRAKVTGLEAFPDFKSLFYAYPPEEYGAKSPEEYVTMSEYYPDEEIETFGTLAIRFALS